MQNYTQQIIWCAIGAAAIICIRKTRVSVTAMLRSAAALLFALMAAQIAMVAISGASLLRNALPFHLCSFTALLTIPMLARRDDTLFQFCFCLGMPGAVTALIFPVVGYSPWPIPARMMFIAIHSIIFFAPALMFAAGHRPRKTAALPVLLIGNILMFCAVIANAMLDTNYMFLAVAPNGTPLELMARGGKAMYFVWLEITAIAVTQVLALAFSPRKAKLMATDVSDEPTAGTLIKAR